MNHINSTPCEPSAEVILGNVRAALAEDIGSGDITAALIPEDAQARARVITREPGVMCGKSWVDLVFAQIDPAISLEWRAGDGDTIGAGDTLFTVNGPARGLLTAERSALNFQQLRSGTASTCQR